MCCETYSFHFTNHALKTASLTHEVSCLGLAMEYLFYGTFCNHPEKGGKMSQKQSTSACTRIRIHSEIGKENKLAFRKSYNANPLETYPTGDRPNGEGNLCRDFTFVMNKSMPNSEE